MDSVKFHLVTDGNCKTETPRSGGANPKFQFRAGIHPSTEDMWNLGLCQEVKTRLSETIPRNQWEITVEFKLDQLSTAVGDTAFSVDVEGEMLRKLHSVILYGVASGRMKMSLFAKGSCTGPDGYERGIIIKDKILQAKMDLGAYSGHNYGFALSNGPLELQKISMWELSDVKLSIEGTYGFLRNTGLEGEGESEVNIENLETGVGTEVIIIGKNNAIIRCPERIIYENCSGLAALVTEGTDESMKKVKELRMLKWSKDEILAFLTYLYCQGTEKAKADQSIAMAVLEIGYKFEPLEFKGLKEKMKEILLKTRSSHFYFSEDIAARIRNFGERNNDIQLERKGRDVLKWLEGVRSPRI